MKRNVFGTLTNVSTAVHDEDLVDAMRYCYNDILTTNRYATSWAAFPFKIKKVIYHDPATIVLWTNGEKTVVKCNKYECYDPEKGLAMAVCKYVFGDDYKKVFKDYAPILEEIKQ